jgi:hypothetical protein
MTYSASPDLAPTRPIASPLRDLPFIFFAAGTLAVTCGMLWGIRMAMSQDFSTAPAHAHLNLAGWVTMALFGLYYRLTPPAAATMLARIHCAVAIIGLILFVPGIAIVNTGGGEGLAVAGSLATLASMLIFLYTVLRFGFGRQD